MNQEPVRRRMRWWIPASILLLASGGAASVWMAEVPFLEPLLIGIGLLTALLIGLWYLLLTGLSWKRRCVLFLIAAGCVSVLWFTLARLTRVEGSIGGSGIPRLVWKWSPRLEGTQRALVLESGADSARGRERGAGMDFPQFLGPDRSGVIASVPLRREWRETLPEKVWRQPVGLGWSAFAVSGRHAVTQEQRGEDELVVCYELETGRGLWAHTNRARFSESLGGDGPRATPTIHQGRVYAMGATGKLDCLEEDTGRPVWSRDVLAENRLSNLTWGKSCSPMISGDLVVVTGGNEREKTLLAYDRRTGKPAWQAGRDRASYCSPVLADLCGQEQILMVNAHSVTGHDPADGRILWEYPWPADYAKATQPLVVATNEVFIAAGYGVGCALLKISGSTAGGWSVTELWKTRNLKPKFTNLVRRGRYVYGLDDGVLACVSLEQGKREWKDGRYGHGQILLMDDLLLVQAESGDFALVELGPDAPRERARFSALKGKTWNNPALAGNLLLVRNDRDAACYRLPLRAGTP